MSDELCAYPNCMERLVEGDGEYCEVHQKEIDDAMANPPFLSPEADDPKEDEDGER